MDLNVVQDDIFPAELEKNEDILLPMPEEISYYSEVHSIMYAWGDVKNPLENSVKLMCNILQGQMALLVKNAEDIMHLQKGKKISHEELLFLMRKNKVLLKRLLLFLSVEDANSSLLTSFKRSGNKLAPEKGERVSQCLKYLCFIEKFTGDLKGVLSDKNITDHVYFKRIKRRDLMAKLMPAEEYESFHETLKVTFCQQHTTEIFKTWLQQSSCTTTDITPLALSIIHFLARETIAGIVDAALKIKSRKCNDNDCISVESVINPLNDIQKHDTANVLSQSDQKSCANNESDFIFDAPVNETKSKIPSHSHKKSSSKKCETCEAAIPSSKRKLSGRFLVHDKQFYDSKAKSETNCDIPDKSELDNKFPSTCNATGEDSSKASKKIKKEFNFSLNFQAKPFFICCDGAKTYESSTSSPTEVDRFHKNTDTKDDKDLATSCFIEYIDESVLNSSKTENSNSRSDFRQHTGHIFTIPQKMDSQVYLFPEQAITPEEIESAFIHFQHSLPMSYLMKTKLPLPSRKVNLVCLADPDQLM